MDLGEIISCSFKYPFTDFKRLAIVFVLFFMMTVSLIGLELNNEIIVYAGLVTFIVACLIIPGYLISVLRQGTLVLKELPCVNIKKNVIDTLKVIVLDIVYMIIPTVMVMILVGILIFMAPPYPDILTQDFSASLIYAGLIVAVVSALLFIIFALLLTVAKARLAKYDSLSKALSFTAVYRDIRRIRIGKFIAWVVLMGIILGLIDRLAIFLLLFIPHAGIILYVCIVAALLLIIYYYSLGLLYGDEDSSYDLKGFEKELMEFRIKKGEM